METKNDVDRVMSIYKSEVWEGLKYVDPTDKKEYKMILKHDRPWNERQVGRCLSILWRLVSDKAKEGGRPPLRLGDLVSDFKKKSLSLKCGRRLLELSVLGDLDCDGRCQIVQNLDDSTLGPVWLTQDTINEMATAANAKLMTE